MQTTVVGASDGSQSLPALGHGRQRPLGVGPPTLPTFVERFGPGFDTGDHTLALGADRPSLIGREEADLDRLGKVILVLPVPAPVRADPNVEEMIGGVEPE